MAEEKKKDKVIISMTPDDYKKVTGAIPETTPVEKVVEEKLEKLKPWERFWYKSVTKRLLKREIRSITKSLDKLSPNTPEYTAAAQNLKTCSEALKALEESDTNLWKAILGLIGTLGAIILIVIFENRGTAFRSKAFGLLPKSRI